jgi:hypothetical protein
MFRLLTCYDEKSDQVIGIAALVSSPKLRERFIATVHILALEGFNWNDTSLLENLIKVSDEWINFTRVRVLN